VRLNDDSLDVPSATSAGTPIGRYRWVICALLFFATTINYMDRQVLAILAPTLKTELGWSETNYGNINAAFQAAYALGLVTVGNLMDRLGTRKGFSLAIIFWSLAGMATALATSVQSFVAARFALGLGEAGNFPGAIKTVTEWFPSKERALATGIFNSGSNVGAIIAPLAVPLIALQFGWRGAFIVVGALGFIWLAFWLALYRRPEEHPRLSSSELAYIQSDPIEPTTKIPWASLIGYRQTWAFIIGKFLTDPVWWFFLTWLPKFLNKQYGLTLTGIGLPLVIVYLMADVGSIGGGWLSSSLLKRGRSSNAARKTAMLVCALCVVPVSFAGNLSNVWVAVFIIGLAAAAHQGWSANLFTLVPDMFPRRAVGSVVGIGGMAGALGGMFVNLVVGPWLDATQSNYLPIFVIAGCMYLIALLIIHLLVPRLEPALLDKTVVEGSQR
jgi:ACS family hexuronate transporter-like MFS transporter